MQPLSGNQRPDLLTPLMNMSFVLRLPRKCIFADPLQMSHACHHFWKCYKTLTFWSLLTRSTIPCACHAKRDLSLQKWSVHGVFCTFWPRNVLRATTACTFSTSEPPKMVRTWCVLYILTSKWCFAPQRRALFRHRNFQKWSERGVFCTFWTFSISQLPKVLRDPGVLYILTCKCAPQRRAIFHLSSGQLAPPPAALASLLFDPPGPQIIGKTNVSRFSYLFTHLHLLSSYSFSSTLLSSNLSLLSASSLLCFSSVHIVGSLTSKLPSMIYRKGHYQWGMGHVIL